MKLSVLLPELLPPHAVMLSAIVAASAPASNLRFMIFPPIITLWNSLCGSVRQSRGIVIL